MSPEPHTLPLSTALTPHPAPPGEKCAICLEHLTSSPPPFSSSPPITSPTSPSIPAPQHPNSTNSPVTDPETVITLVCGPTHFFHRLCITSWWTSSTPHLNTCPLDRALCYGTERVGQTAVNLPVYAEFLGHNPHVHGVRLPGGFVGRLMAHFAQRGDGAFPGYLLLGGDVEVLERDGANAGTGQTVDGTDALHSDAEDASVEETRAGDHGTCGCDDNDAFADGIARGLHPAPRVTPLSAQTGPEGYEGLEGSRRLVGFFAE